MEYTIRILSFALLINVIYCHDSESSESNRGESTPFYDNVIYNDIADIINEVANNGGSPFDVLLSDSESGENLEDLLGEYQNFLEKAHRQRKTYMASQNSKKKNKVPSIRHDLYSKTKTDGKYDNVNYSNRFNNPSIFKFPQAPFAFPFDTFIPLNPKAQYNKPDFTASVPIGNNELLHPFEKLLFGGKSIHLQPMFHKQIESIKSCYCQKAPCDCNCKECIIDSEHTEILKNSNFDDEKRTGWPHSLYDSPPKKSEQVEGLKDILTDNTLNIRIKVDVQLPKFQELGKSKFRSKDKTYTDPENVSKELSSGINLPLPLLNFPVPMDMLGFQKVSKYNREDISPIHKLTIHKKKKSRANNTTKKHRKKIITFHKIQLEQQPIINFGENNETYTTQYNSTKFANDTNSKPNMTQIGNNTIKKVEDISNESQSNNTFVAVTLANIVLNVTEDLHKYENSIESDYSKIPNVITTKSPILIRKKRNVRNNITIINNIKNNETVPNIKLAKEKNTSKKSDKNGQSDDELLYWANVTRPKVSNVYAKNITTFIIENENKKSKFNISKETIQRNHTQALEQAIFGKVDWDDMNQVAPAFMSFVGKYICGVLTFCSQDVCHSMNCAHKSCIHRVCKPEDRLNNKGHCVGSGSKDSVAAMESIMDLPSNVAFEMVDILQSKMLGKLFGKATFCINSKCITFSAAKKNFAKSRCTIKEINPAGHCIHAKNVKIM